VLLLWSKDGRSAAMVPVEDVVPSARERTRSQLVFDAYGKERLLRSALLADLGVVTVPATHEEVALARQAADATAGSGRLTASSVR
jgi:hypothetical protein